MTDKQVLKKAIEKAEKAGSKIAREYAIQINSSKEYDWEADTICKICCFSHDFAKAFFPVVTEERRKRIFESARKTRAAYIIIHDWRFHLQKMVLEKNPILYLKMFI